MICQVPGQSESAEFAADEDARSLDPSSSESHPVTAADAAIHRSFLPICSAHRLAERIDRCVRIENQSIVDVDPDQFLERRLQSSAVWRRPQLRPFRQRQQFTDRNDADKVAARRTAQIVRLIDGLPKLIIAKEPARCWCRARRRSDRALAQFLKPIVDLLVGLVSGPLADDRSHAALVALLL